MAELDFSKAVEMAAAIHGDLDTLRVVELEDGWFLPYVSDPTMRVPGRGSGVIVNKRDGAVFPLGSVRSLDEDLDFYNRGYRSSNVDLVVIIAVRGEKRSLDLLCELRPQTVEVSYEAGTIWRIS